MAREIVPVVEIGLAISADTTTKIMCSPFLDVGRARAVGHQIFDREQPSRLIFGYMLNNPDEVSEPDESNSTTVWQAEWNRGDTDASIPPAIIPFDQLPRN